MFMLEKVYENLKKADVNTQRKISGLFNPPCAICLDGEKGGRSYEALEIGTRYLATVPGVRIYGAEDTRTPGSTITKGFENLSKEYRKINYVCVSGSGKSEGPNDNMREILDYVKTNELKNPPNITLATYDTDSPIANVAEECENYGCDINIMELPGRPKGSRSYRDEKYLEWGILDDLFEIETAEATNIWAKAVLENVPPGGFYKFYTKNIDEMKERHEAIEKIRDSDSYMNYVDSIADPLKSIFSFGQGVSGNVVRMNNNRLGHVRPMTAEHPQHKGKVPYPRNYVFGESSVPNPTEDSVFLIVSKSGTRKAPTYVAKAEQKKAECFLVTKYGDSSYPQKLRLDGDRFYPDAITLLTAANLDVAYKLLENGVEISEEKIKSYHIDDKIHHFNCA